MKKVAALMFVIGLTNSIIAQNQDNSSNGEVIKYGFTLGVNYSNIIIPESPIPNGGSLKNGSGFHMGILMDAPLSERVAIVPKAELTFRAGQINFENDPDGLQSIGVMSTTIDAIVHFNFKIASNNLSPYIILGPDFSYELNDGDASSSQFASVPNLSMDMGLGFNKVLDNFNLAPEIRYSFGLFNVNKNPVLQKVYAHSVTLSLSFKG